MVLPRLLLDTHSLLELGHAFGCRSLHVPGVFEALWENNFFFLKKEISSDDKI